MTENIGAKIARQRIEREEKEKQASQFFGTNEEIANAKREYYRNYYASNKDKYKESRERYWENKARSFFDNEE